MIEAGRMARILKAGLPKRELEGEPVLGGWYTNEEVAAAVRAMRESMDWQVGFGFIEKTTVAFERAFARYCGVKHAVSVATASIGLDMAMRCLDLGSRDEVICPAVNFKASPLAVLGARGKLVLAESDPRTFNLDPKDVERRITPRTRAIFPVHMNGLSAPMDDLIAIARRRSRSKARPIRVIGDAARACGGGYRGTKIGKKGWMNIFSFHTMKLMSTLGEGGMITTDDGKLAARLCAIRQWGHDKEWGSSYKLTKIQAAVGLVQIRRLDAMLARRVRLARLRSKMLEGVGELTLPLEPSGYAHTYYLYTLMVPPSWAGKRRDRVIEILKKKYRIGCIVANPPVYQVSAYIRGMTKGQSLPVAGELGGRIFCPSLHPLMTDAQNEYVASAVISAVETARRG